MSKQSILQGIKGGLVVSCQALPDEPLHGSFIMAKMALAAKRGGAAGIRANGYDDIIEIKKEVNLPVIGLVKNKYPDSDIHITPSIPEIVSVVAAGAEIVAMDATKRVRPDNRSLEDIVFEVRRRFGDILLMADISTAEEAVKAEKLGFDIVGTTLSGYTPYTASRTLPDFKLMKSLVGKLSIPVIAEGGIWLPEEMRKALDIGVHAVVIGTAITRPMEITRRFTEGVTR